MADVVADDYAIAQVVAQRTKLVRSRLDQYLSLSVYDRTTRECYYPVPKKARPAKPKPGRPVRRPKPSGPCKGMANWTKLPARFVVSPKVTGAYARPGRADRQWKRRERHQIVVRWRLGASAPNDRQALTSSFLIRYRAVR